MNKKRIRAVIICAFVLAIAILAVFNTDIEFSDSKDNPPPITQNIKESPKTSPTDEKENKPDDTPENDIKEEQRGTAIEETVPIPERHICTIEIRCDTVKDTSKLENQAVAPYVPASGVILETAEIEFTLGESVFDILLRAAGERNIHMEFRSDSVYGGKYIEGINYLYEMDGGALSGWMYKVNGQFPNYGCDSFKVKDGDAIVWMYTCDLGMDVGDNSVW